MHIAKKSRPHDFYLIILREIVKFFYTIRTKGENKIIIVDFTLQHKLTYNYSKAINYATTSKLVHNNSINLHKCETEIL